MITVILFFYYSLYLDLSNLLFKPEVEGWGSELILTIISSSMVCKPINSVMKLFCIVLLSLYLPLVSLSDLLFLWWGEGVMGALSFVFSLLLSEIETSGLISTLSTFLFALEAEASRLTPSLVFCVVSSFISISVNRQYSAF